MASVDSKKTGTADPTLAVFVDWKKFLVAARLVASAAAADSKKASKTRRTLDSK